MEVPSSSSKGVEEEEEKFDLEAEEDTLKEDKEEEGLANSDPRVEAAVAELLRLKAEDA